MTTTTDEGKGELAIEGGQDDPLAIRIEGQRVVVERGSRVAALDFRNASEFRDGSEDVRKLVGGDAVAAFRRQIGQYKRHVDRLAQRRDDRALAPIGDAFLLSAALVATLAGDPNAFDEARDTIVKRLRTAVRDARFQQRDCVSEYERALMSIDQQRTECLQAANDRNSWYGRAAERLGCEMEFMGRAEGALAQFLACNAIPLG